MNRTTSVYNGKKCAKIEFEWKQTEITMDAEALYAKFDTTICHTKKLPNWHTKNPANWRNSKTLEFDVGANNKNTSVQAVSVFQPHFFLSGSCCHELERVVGFKLFGCKINIFEQFIGKTGTDEHGDLNDTMYNALRKTSFYDDLGELLLFDGFFAAFLEIFSLRLCILCRSKV